MIRHFQLGRRTVDLDRQAVVGPEGEVPLSANEVGLLAVLVARSGAVVPRDELLVEGLGYRRVVSTRAIDQAIWRLRKKIEDEPSSPVHLRSETHEGYRLVLDSHRSQAPFGRALEVARLRQLLSSAPEVWIVGPPGIGRHALVQLALPDAVLPRDTDPEGGAIRISTRLPDDPATPHLRLGPLDPEDARRLLVERVLAGRGAVSLTATERQHLDAVLAAAGGHPGTLVAIADACVLRPLSPIAPPVSHAVRQWTEGFTPELTSAVAALAQYPDPFDAEDAVAVVGEDGLRAVWRACGIEAVGPERRFVVLPVVRAAVGDHPVSATHRERFRHHVKQQLLGAARAALEHEDEAARDQLQAWKPRLLALWEGGDPELLLVGGVSELPVLPWVRQTEPTDPDLAVCRQLLVAFAHDFYADPDGGRAAFDKAWEIVGTGEVWWPLRVVVARASIRWRYDQPEPAFAWLVDRARELVDEVPNALTRATLAHIRGRWALKRGLHAEARTELLVAQQRYREIGARWLRASALGYVAFAFLEDGRPDEAVAWVTESLKLGGRLGPARESLHRESLATFDLIRGDLDSAEQQITLIDALGTDHVAAELLGAWCRQLRGDVQVAMVRAQGLRAGLVAGHEAWWETVILEAWGRLRLGEREAAIGLLWPEALPSDGPPVERGPLAIEVGIVRAVAVALDGDCAPARVILDRTLEDLDGREPPRWWPAVGRLVEVFATLARGAAVDLDAVQEEVRRSGIGSLSQAVALDVLGPIAARLADHRAGPA